MTATAVWTYDRPGFQKMLDEIEAVMWVRSLRKTCQGLGETPL